MAALALGWGSTAGAATAAQECEAAKLKASGKKAECLLDAEADSVKDEEPANTAQCETDFETAFAAAEDTWGQEDCPTFGDINEVEALVDACRDDVADALSGFPPAPCGQFPATGQTNSFRAGDDGDLEAGADLSYTDTGTGTIIDNNTGLEWEKKSDDGTINDKDNVYTWEDAFAVHIAGLNTVPCFAGHCDWRLSNAKELQSIVNFGAGDPSVSSAFNTNCVADATVLNGSCTAASFYWSSTTFADDSVFAWLVNFSLGFVNASGKGNRLHVRAVRGGSP